MTLGLAWLFSLVVFQYLVLWMAIVLVALLFYIVHSAYARVNLIWKSRNFSLKICCHATASMHNTKSTVARCRDHRVLFIFVLGKVAQASFYFFACFPCL